MSPSFFRPSGESISTFFLVEVEQIKFLEYLSHCG
jgi:hypothetical protein